MAIEVKEVGIKVVMDLTGYTGSANEYRKSLEDNIATTRAFKASVDEMAKTSGVAPNEMAKAVKNLTKEEEAATKAIKANLTAIASQGRSMASFGRTIQQVGTRLTHAFTVPIVAGFTAAGKSAIDFEKQMKGIQSIGGQSEKELETLSGTLIDMSTDLTKSSDSAIELAETFYFLQGSGFEGAEGMEVLRVSAIAAQAGMTDTSAAAEALIFSLNAYGAGAEEAQHFADVLFRTVDIGVVSFEELARSMGFVTGRAATSGLSIEELGAAIATVSKTTKGASKVARELNRFLEALVSPSKELDSVFQVATGHTAAWVLENEGLAKVLGIVQESTGGVSIEIDRLFKDTLAQRAVTSLLREDVGAYNEALLEMADVTGATADAAAINIDTTAAALDNLANNAIAAAIEMGELFLPMIKDIAEQLKEWTEAIQEMDPATKQAFLATLVGLAALGPATSAVGTGMELVGNVSVITAQRFGGSFAAMGKAASGLLLKIGALTTAFAVLLWTTGKFRQVTREGTEFFESQEEVIFKASNTFGEYSAEVDKVTKKQKIFNTIMEQVRTNPFGALLIPESLFKDMDTFTKEQFEMQKAIENLGSVTQEFADSLNLGNENLKGFVTESRKLPETGFIEYMKEMWAYSREFGEDTTGGIPKGWAEAWTLAAAAIRDTFLDMATILEEQEVALNELILEGEEERSNVIAENSAKTIAMRREQQLEVTALEGAYYARQADLQAAGDAEGLKLLTEAFQEKRLKMEQSFAQDDLDLEAANKRKLLEQERGQLESLISLHEANAEQIEAQREKLGMTVFLTALEKAMEDGEIDKGEKNILLTIGEAFGLRIEKQITFGEHSLILAAALGTKNEDIVRTTATNLSAIWAAYREDELKKMAELNADLAALALPESIVAGTDYSSLFTNLPSPNTGGGGGGGGGGTSTPTSAVKPLQETVKDVADAINEAIEAFEKLVGYRSSPKLRQALTDIANDIADAVRILGEIWETPESPTKGEAKKAAEFAEYAGQVASALGDASESLTKVADYTKVSEAQLRLVAEDIKVAVAVMHEAWASGDGLANRAGTYGEHASKIATAFGDAAEAFSSVRYYTGVSRKSMVNVAQDMDEMIRILEWHMKQMGPNLIPRAEEFAEGGAKVSASIGAGVEALGSIADYSGVSRKDSIRFAEDMARVMKEYAWVFSKLGPNVGPLAVKFAESADVIMGTAKGAVEALTSMKWYGGVSDARIRRLVSDIAKIIWLLNSELSKLGSELLQDTAHFSEDGKAAMEFIGSAIEPMIALQEYSGVSKKTSERFAEDLALTIENLGLAMAQLAPDVLPYALEFSEGASTISEMVAGAVEALVLLQNDYKGVDEKKITRLRDDFILLASALSGLGDTESITPGLIEFLDIISQLVSELNSLPETIHIDFSVSTSGNIPQFASGGVVPGPTNKPQLAIVHGGETITPAATANSQSMVNYNRTHNWQVDAHYANQQSEGALRNDIEMLQLLSMGS